MDDTLPSQEELRSGFMALVKKGAVEKITAAFPNHPTMVWFVLEGIRRRQAKVLFTRGSIVFQMKGWLTEDETMKAVSDLVTLGKIVRVEESKGRLKYRLESTDAAPSE